ncbi:MarR family winged helix-turn-helix transcriptional regulator [Bifidobacterium pseudolongum]|uniref:MarR family transcriptional regulator n=1 Tax=Bifidobacterium pseudolongum subsp. globosum TaxID=1690 RepID=A0A2N3R4P1_9BIFI|nr:MarR family winged helix-turn-helix transcriptional regulator [Bifidobacterium pseudolongum]PKV03596.1 MarR family transcriptional regulator [Bifidobacterium pseudolongum subsp. globosum]
MNDKLEYEPLHADLIEHAQEDQGDIDAQLAAFFEEFRRVDLIYGAYGRRCGFSLSGSLIFDYICENDGTSQREICAYTLLPRQTVNNAINALVSQGLIALEGSKRDRRVKRIRLTEEGEACRARVTTPLREAELQAMAALEPDERRAMIVYVDKFMNALEQRIGGLGA